MLVFPKEHFSWNQLLTWEKSRELYKENYFGINPRKPLINRGMAKGKQMADALVNGELSGDEILDTVIVRLPKFEVMDIPFLVEMKIEKDKMPLWIQPDSYKEDLSEYLEYKTSQTVWTKKQADEHRQIDFYDVGIYIKTGKIPKHSIIDVRTQKEFPEDKDSRLITTGEFKVIKTERSLTDILKMMKRIKKAIKEISEEYNNYLF